MNTAPAPAGTYLVSYQDVDGFVWRDMTVRPRKGRTLAQACERLWGRGHILSASNRPASFNHRKQQQGMQP